MLSAGPGTSVAPHSRMLYVFRAGSYREAGAKWGAGPARAFGLGIGPRCRAGALWLQTGPHVHPPPFAPGVRTGTWMLRVSVAEGHAGAADC